MHDVFISHAEADGGDAISLAEELMQAGYSAWYYERDAVIGVSYLHQVVDAIDQCHLFLLVISSDSLTSVQVDSELIQAFESKKRLVPLLKGVSFNDFSRQKRDWKMAFGPSVAKPLVTSDIGATVAELVVTLKGMGLRPRESTAAPVDDEIFVRLQLMPDELVRQITPLVDSSELHCTYHVLTANESEPATFSTNIVLITGAMFIYLRNVRRDAFVQVRISYRDQSWESTFFRVDSVPVSLFPNDV